MLEQVQLAKTGRTTSRLGFGGSSLMGSLGRAQSLAVLEEAFDAGVRHFDVAPMYGYGQAESCLGEFLSRHRGDVTVTTKYGIPPGKNPGMLNLARSIVRPVIKALPGLKRGLTNVASKATAPGMKASFTAAEALDSLHHSLTELRTGHIDVWLLHEATLSDLNDDLLSMMRKATEAGKIGAFGVGSERVRVEEILGNRPEFCPVVQFEWSILDAPIPSIESFRIHHRSLTDNFRDLHRQLSEDKSRCAEWSREAGADLADAEVLASLMLKAALLENPKGIVLFSSKHPSHIRKNAATVADASLEEPARRLYALIQADIVTRRKQKEQIAG